MYSEFAHAMGCTRAIAKQRLFASAYGYKPVGLALRHRVGVKFNWRAAWVGAHYSEHNKRLCVNLIPFVTLWWVQPGGMLP